MLEFFSTIYFEEVTWLYAIPVISVMLGILLWKKQSTLNSWQSSTETSSRQTYLLPGCTSLIKESEITQQKSQNLTALIKYIQYLILVTLFMTALAQPYQQGQRIPEPPSVRDIVFLVDTSVTMSLKDYQSGDKRIDRMSMLKNVLRHFISQLNGSRIGINVFSEKTYTLTPLTTDYQLISSQLERLEPAVLTGRTTNPSQALLYTAKKYSEIDTKPTLIILTDLNRPDRKIDPRVAAKYLKQQGFRLHVIGIGAGSQQAKDDDISSLIYQPANFVLLDDIAKAGNGNFFWAKDIDSLNSALSVIQQSEKRIVDSEPEHIKQPVYMWFVCAALLWICGWQIAPIFRVLK